MKGIIGVLAVLAALASSSTAWAPPQGSADIIVTCTPHAGPGGVQARFIYEFTGPNNLTAEQAITVDGNVANASTHTFTGSSTSFLSAVLPPGAGPFEVVVTTEVRGAGGELGASESATVSCERPPPPPPFCETHPNADRCNDEPPPPCVDCTPPPPDPFCVTHPDQCGELPETGQVNWWENRYLIGALGLLLSAVLIATGALLATRNR